jgi:hypothetical protein
MNISPADKLVIQEIDVTGFAVRIIVVGTMTFVAPVALVAAVFLLGIWKRRRVQVGCKLG